MNSELSPLVIERIQVEEGFLDGLDLSFAPGLNVLIGPRGSGKTSVIELIRYCLGVEALTEKALQASKQHALSILGSGRVSITYSLGGKSFISSRSAENWSKPSVHYREPLILAQNEIEAIGLNDIGRLKLIDSLVHSPSSAVASEDRIVAKIRSQSAERRAVRTRWIEIKTKISEIGDALTASTELRNEHIKVLDSLAAAAKETERLEELNSQLAALSVEGEVFNRTRDAFKSWVERFGAVTRQMPVVEPWPASAGPIDALSPIRATLLQGNARLRQTLDSFEKSVEEVDDLLAQNQSQRAKLEDESRGIRRLLESLQKGAGEIAKRLAILKERESQIDSLKGLEKATQLQHESLQRLRRMELDELETLREEKYEKRLSAVRALNSALGPRIKVDIERSARTTSYANAIIGALRGSGIRFNDLAPQIADQVSPREFIEAVESDNPGLLGRLIGISASRASKVIERLSEDSTEDILTAPVEDGISFSLLDGREYKGSEQLSTGQRCTVVLPILLQQSGAPLIVDQPEDHLDNAFVVETLIKALRSSHNSQLIFSTHNANIPVLGNADQVTLMGSDGQKGFVVHSGPLNNPSSVSAITDVMEGGLEAFDRRARFYHSAEDYEA